MRPKIKNRIGEERLNNQGCLMKIVEYNNSNDIVVEFQDEHKRKIHTRYSHFLSRNVSNPYIYEQRLNQENINNQGCLMKIIEYRDCENILVEFQDSYKAKVNASYKNFVYGCIKNPYFPNVFGVGMIGMKCPTYKDGKQIKEYRAWKNILERCYDKKLKEKYETYENVICCDEWLNYENFYKWLHSQENFDKWLNSDKWAIDKDILVKGNKVYSPDTCCLVPNGINTLFTKSNSTRGNLPIGVYISGKKFASACGNPITNKREYLGTHQTPMDAFLAYKHRKEEVIRHVAEIEYSKNNITKECYEAMMGYEVEITD